MTSARSSVGALGSYQRDGTNRHILPDIHLLTVHAGSLSELTSRTVRDKFARLNQTATLLSLEAAREVLDFWGDNSGPIAWRLSEADVRQILAQRFDFSVDEIQSLAL